MEDFNEVIDNSLAQYFATLTKQGYANQTQINALIALSSLQFVLDKFSDYITEEDIQNIEKAYYCLQDNCAIISDVSLSGDSLFHSLYVAAQLRAVEHGSLRNTQNTLFRIKA